VPPARTAGSRRRRQVDTTFLHRRLKAGQRLTSQGEPFEALYIVADGFFKTFVADETGNQLVLGFPLRGDLVGADGLCNHRHASYAVALTDAEVVVVPFRSIAHLGARSTISNSSSTVPSAASW